MLDYQYPFYHYKKELSICFLLYNCVQVTLLQAGHTAFIYPVFLFKFYVFF